MYNKKGLPTARKALCFCYCTRKSKTTKRTDHRHLRCTVKHHLTAQYAPGAHGFVEGDQHLASLPTLALLSTHQLLSFLGCVTVVRGTVVGVVQFNKLLLK